MSNIADQGAKPAETRSAVVRQAAEWLVLLASPEASAADEAAFNAWVQADPAHLNAVVTMRGFVGKLSAVASDTSQRAVLQQALHKPASGRGWRNAVAAMLLLGAMLGSWQLLNPWSAMFADLSTETAEWKNEVLPDQSHLALASATAVDINFSAHERKLALLKGEILVDIAPDPERPFIVQTPHGTMRALGTRFVVTLTDSGTTLTMLHSRVEAKTEAQDQTRIVSAGEQVVLSAEHISTPVAIDAESVAAAWSAHQLMVQDQPMDQVLDRLWRYRRGIVMYRTADMEAMHVSALLPLDDTDRALQLLASSFPLRIRHLTPWLSWVEKVEKPQSAAKVSQAPAQGSSK
ncbi:FecR family protein [Methylovorus sp. SPW-M1]